MTRKAAELEASRKAAEAREAQLAAEAEEARRVEEERMAKDAAKEEAHAGNNSIHRCGRQGSDDVSDREGEERSLACRPMCCIWG